MYNIKVEIVKYNNRPYIVKRETTFKGDLVYFIQEKIIGTSIIDDIDASSSIQIKVISTPDQIGWLLNDGPPHDRNWNFRGRYVEPIIDTREGPCEIIMEEYYETGLEAPLPMIPIKFQDKVILFNLS